MSRPLTGPRRGIALMVALLATVIVGALVATAFFASTQEHRLGRNTLVAQRAFSIAEYGLNSEIGNFSRERYLWGSANYMQPGAVDDKPVYVAQGDTARVKITRLSENTFWLVASGRASMGDARLKSVQRTSALVRIAYPSVNVRGGFTTAGKVRINGSGKIYGNDLMDTGRPEFKALDAWATCDSIASQNLAGVVVPDTAYVDGKVGNITGSPAVQRDAIAADTNTYVKYGSETWKSLQSNADLKFPPLVLPTTPKEPTLTPSGKCDYANPGNWGEPWRPVSSSYVAPCADYFPIVFHEGNLHLSGGRGQGVLLVNGDLVMDGGFEWYGLVIISGEVRKSNGNASVFGAMMAKSAGTDGFGADGSDVTGSQSIFFNRCAVESALRGSAILTRAPQRSWAQFY